MCCDTIGAEVIHAVDALGNCIKLLILAAGAARSIGRVNFRSRLHNGCREGCGGVVFQLEARVVVPGG